MLEITDLHVGYHRDLTIVRGVNLTARANQITAILGANGTGKSTLLKAVAGFLRPSRGDITVAGTSVLDVAPHAMIRRGIAYIPQHPGIFAHMTVEENLLMGAWTFRAERATVRARLDDNYGRFPTLAARRRQRAGSLSGGQQRMVEIGRTMMAQPRLLLVDEPTAGLAKLVRREVYQMLTQLRDEGRTILLVDQEIRDALKIADHVYVLDLGRNRLDGPPSDFADVSKTLWA
jgi:branched-chain amino acid transport system ATP-binding protein